MMMILMMITSVMMMRTRMSEGAYRSVLLCYEFQYMHIIYTIIRHH